MNPQGRKLMQVTLDDLAEADHMVHAADGR